jgi:hypothetical protein
VRALKFLSYHQTGRFWGGIKMRKELVPPLPGDSVEINPQVRLWNLV